MRLSGLTHCVLELTSVSLVGASSMRSNREAPKRLEASSTLPSLQNTPNSTFRAMFPTEDQSVSAAEEPGMTLDFGIL
jgi:hypothetical protein